MMVIFQPEACKHAARYGIPLDEVRAAFSEKEDMFEEGAVEVEVTLTSPVPDTVIVDEFISDCSVYVSTFFGRKLRVGRPSIFHEKIVHKTKVTQKEGAVSVVFYENSSMTKRLHVYAIVHTSRNVVTVGQLFASDTAIEEIEVEPLKYVIGTPSEYETVNASDLDILHT